MGFGRDWQRDLVKRGFHVPAVYVPVRGAMVSLLHVRRRLAERPANVCPGEESPSLGRAYGQSNVRFLLISGAFWRILANREHHELAFA